MVFKFNFGMIKKNYNFVIKEKNYLKNILNLMIVKKLILKDLKLFPKKLNLINKMFKILNY